MKFWLAVLVVIAVAPAAAHHPFTPYFDASKPGTVTGTVIELRYINPHVVLIVDGTGPDGRPGRWAFEGNSPNSFTQHGVKNLRERLQPGTRVTISGWAAKDPKVPVFAGREITFADGSKLAFGSTPAEHDRWQCLNDPCPYKYPEVPAR